MLNNQMIIKCQGRHRAPASAKACANAERGLDRRWQLSRRNPLHWFITLLKNIYYGLWYLYIYIYRYYIYIYVDITYIYICRYYIYIIIYSVVNQVNAFIHGLVMVIPSFFDAVSPPLTLYIYIYRYPISTKDTRPEIWRPREALDVLIRSNHMT